MTTTRRTAAPAPGGGGESARTRRFGARAFFAAAGVFTAAVPLTILAVLIREKSTGLRALDQDISGAAHGFVLDRPWLGEILNDFRARDLDPAGRPYSIFVALYPDVSRE